MASKAEEICNKVIQLDNNKEMDKEKLISNIGSHIASTFLYLNLLCHRLGIDMEQAIKDEFNKVSKREKLDFNL